jgi:hypothetical protein
MVTLKERREQRKKEKAKQGTEVQETTDRVRALVKAVKGEDSSGSKESQISNYK